MSRSAALYGTAPHARHSGQSPIGYYVHHHGAGHGALALALAGVLGDRLVGLGSGPPPTGWAGPWVALPRDDEPPPTGDPTRGGAWHWAPAGHPGTTARMRRIAGWVAAASPSALVVDVSCEVTVLGALLGVPTVAVVMHGRDRDDRPHRLAWDSADALVTMGAPEPWLAPWAGKTTAIGLTSRFDARPLSIRERGRTVVVLLPAGGHTVGVDEVERAARATAADGWRWHVAGEVPPSVDRSASPVRWEGRLDDPWPLLRRARVVVAACGRGSVADIAAARRPAVLLPQDRPYAEQDALADHLDGEAPVAIRRRWPAAAEWPDLLAQVAVLDPHRWSPLHDRTGAHRLARVIADVTDRTRGVRPHMSATPSRSRSPR